jgi:large repetitive protein
LKKRCQQNYFTFLAYFTLFNLNICLGCFAQSSSPTATLKTTANIRQTLVPTGAFIENIGQYGKAMAGYENMGAIKYGYEGLGMPVLFTSKGLIHLQRKVEKISEWEEERLVKQGIPEEEIERKMNVTDRAITMEWMGANADARIITEDKTTDYYTYGLLASKAYGYKKIIYIELYPGIDLVYSFTQQSKAGFEYSLLVKPGADLSVVKMKYGGDVKSIKTDGKGNLIIRSDIDGISTSVPVSYYGETLLNKNNGEIKSAYKIEDKQISFSFPDGYDASKAIVIDPFVTGTGNLPGPNAGKAKDVDFDYSGNIYVTGGGAFSSAHSLAKYDAAGALLWTFNGTLAIPSWTFGTYHGGWMVEKPSGNVYLGQGFNPATGFQVIRVSATGLYDNYITTANPNFREAWKMFWSCNNGSPQILVAGGGTNANTNFGVFTPPSTTITSLNVTGIPYTPGVGWAQDIADFVFDPANNDMYSIYGSTFGTPSISNRIYKNTAPYSGASIAWNVASGYNTVQEAANRPYLVSGGLSDNSANMLWVNGSYLYYWDGKNLKAFNKTTGAGVGTPLITGNTAFMQGGIIADACNNIFVGEGNGIIKVYNFDGNTFNDAPVDIPIVGFAGKAVYDLAYDESKKLIYASGDGFVTSVDVSSYCTTTPFTVNVARNCLTATATATVSPAPPPGSTITYTLFIGTTQIAANTSGIFTGLIPNTTYTIRATINLACSGSQASTSFVFPGPTINIDAQTNTTCGASTGSITVTGSGGGAPYTYSIDGTNFQPTGTFNGLAAGVYTITVRDAGGCPNKITVTVLNTDGPALTFTQTNADCGNAAGTVTANATGGTLPYQYSINGGTTYQSGNFFTGLAAGQYILVVRDANNCTNRAIVTITTSPAPLLTAVPASATCNQNNGTINAFGSGGTAPLQYSINGNTFQASGVFNGLTPGAYTVTVKDATGCTMQISVTVGNSPAPTVSATPASAGCGNTNGTVTATGSGGITPYQYSINGTTFQTANVFTGLAPGTYTITIKDNTGCTSITTVTVGSTNGPTVTATTGASLCNTNSGTITASGSGGTAPYQYSINGTVFQAGTTFTGMAPGNYVVYVRDFGGCIGTVSVVVSAVAGPLITAVATASSCTINDGTITATGTGGTAPLEYSVNGTNYFLANVFTGLAPGVYTVYVRDANSCIKTTTVTVANASGFTLSVATISASCANNGFITAAATGGTAPLQYSINGTAYQASNIFSGLAPGTYTVYVKDANNCFITNQAIVGSATSLSLTVTVPQPANCGSANGAIVVSGSGGIAPLSYSIDGIAYQALDTFLNVAPGNYTVYVKDAGGCIATQSATVTTSGAGPGISTFTVQTEPAYPCNMAGGRITNPRVNGSNCATCTFSLDFGPFVPNTTQLFLNVPAGVHAVTARDANGCTKTIFVTVNVAVLATATATVIGTACNTSNGSISLTGVGPAPYHASITGIGGPFVTFDPTHTFTGLAPGTYNIIIADDEDFNDVNDPGNCRTTITVIVPSIGGPSIATTHINPNCNSNTGSITATGSGGSGPYTYNINGGAFIAGGVFNNLAPGNYIVQVRDNTGCVNAATVNLVGSATPTVTATTLSATCNTNNGVITATGIGGTAPLEYSLNGTVFQTSNIFTDLAPGAYTLYVKDVNNCLSTLALSITNTPRVKASAFTIAATCGNNDGSIAATGSDGVPPYQYSLNGTVYQSSNTFTGLAAGFYTVTIKDARDCITTTGVTIANSGTPTLNLSATAATCGNANGSITATATGGTLPLEYSKDGTVFQPTGSFGGLLPGTYVITVRDGNGCINTKSILAANINGPQTLTAVIADAACGNADGRITATATGGTPPYQYSRDGITYQASNVFNAVPAGNYTLYVKDNNGCIKQTPLAIANLPGPMLTATSSPASCGLSDGTITAIATGGTLPLQYSRNGTTFQTSNIFTGLAAGPYTITVRDARNCPATFNINVSTIGGAVIPTFAPIGPFCQNATPPALPLTSTNGITGTWNPATISTAAVGTVNYVFTPVAGQCATQATLPIIINANITPTFATIGPLCQNTTPPVLPLTSGNSITGTWNPATINTTTIGTTNYIFTPATGQCATIFTLPISITASITPVFTPIGSICQNATAPALPLTSNNGINGTWNPATISTAAAGTTNYIFTPAAGQCASQVSFPVTITANIAPTFVQIGPLCQNSTAPLLPATSSNGIAGTWNPTTISTAATGITTYTFTPGAGQCATTKTMDIEITAQITTTFNQIGPLCQNSAAPTLPLVSTNGITGTWNPATISTATAGTTTYTFTPNAGQCAGTTTMSIVIATSITPTFAPIGPLCQNATAPTLPSSSTNGITGAWNPVTISTATAGTTNYIFTPNAGQCATPFTLPVNINSGVTPTFTPVAPICSGATLAPLPTTSTNGIAGSWSPALNNTVTTTYTFTPNAGQCATTATLEITINPILSPTINCGVSTSSSVIFNWAAVAGATGYTVSYQIGANPVVNIGAIGNVLTYSVTGLAAGDNVIITVTPTAGTGICFTSTTKTCTATACTPATATISYDGSFCISLTTPQAVTLTGTGAYTGGTYSSTAGLSINATTGAITPSASTPGTYTVTYTIAASGGCAAVTATTSVIINPLLSPTINCGVSTSTSVAYTWVAVTGATDYTVSYQVGTNPVVNVGAIGNVLTYTVGTGVSSGDNVVITVTPTGGAGTCFISATKTCIATSCTPPTATINYTGPFCISLTTPQAVTLTGTGAYTGGTYSSTTGLSINTTTGAITPGASTAGIYTVTYIIAASGGCAAVTATTQVTITASITPAFTQLGTLCQNATAPTLPLTSNNNITGTWSPATISTTTIGTTTYIFTPSANQCATAGSLSITVDPLPVAPTVNVTQPTCAIPTGIISITSVTAGLTFSLDGAAYATYPSGGYTAIIPGNHTLTAKNTSDCISAVTNITINTAPIAPTVTAIFTNSTCGANDGSITATGSGGTLPYEFSINGGPPQANGVFTGLAAGNYSVTIKDANNCTNTISVTIVTFNNLTVTAIASAATCNNNDGSIIATGLGGNAPYQYSINGGTLQASGVFNGLAANTYTVTIKDSKNCSNTTTVVISLNNTIALNAGNDVTICEGSKVQLPSVSNATNFLWTPAVALSNALILNPIAAPTTTTTYYLTATKGVCAKTDTIIVIVNPAPIANAGADTTICFGTRIQLNGNGGVTYRWSPATYLSNPNIASPIMLPLKTGILIYYVDVIDARGCKSLKTDSVIITVLPPVKIFAGKDTSIAINQPLQLHAMDANNSGFISYTWSPSFGLDNAFTQNPVAVFNKMGVYRYTVTARNAAGCEAVDDIGIKVFIGPDIYMPDAFTPNNDGHNDVLKPILTGMKELKYFSVYNRFGQLLFTTSQEGAGWNGVINGQTQPAGGFVWIAEAVDFNGNTVKRKGTAILIR